MNFTSYSLYVGNSRDFTEYRGFGDYVTLISDEKDVKWEITDTDILEFKSISGNLAEVRAVRTGFCDVMAKRADGGYEVCHISVIDNYTRLTVNRIEFNTDNLTLAKGQTAKVIPILYPKEVYNNGILDKTLIWESSDSDVLETADGKITAKGKGTAKISVTSADVKRRAEITVTVADTPAADIAAENSGVFNMTVGERLKLNARSESEIIWKSDNSYMADVDGEGVVKAYSSTDKVTVNDDGLDITIVPDTVTVYATAKDGGKIAEFRIQISDAPVTVHSVNINKKELTLENEDYITAVITPANIIEKEVEWESSDESVVLVKRAENTPDGISRAKITAKSEGTAFITARYKGKEDKCLVRVKNREVPNINFKDITIEVDEVIKPKISGDFIYLGTDDDIATVDFHGNIMGYSEGEITVYAVWRDSLSDGQLDEIKKIKYEGKRKFNDDELKSYLKVYEKFTLTVADNTPTLRNLHISKETVTYNSINLLWNRAALPDIPDFDRYIVYINGKKTAEVRTLGYTANGLMSDTEYSFKIFAVDKNGNELASKAITQRTKSAPKKIINVLDYGARGDGRVLDTYAIQKAIDNCPSCGEVYLPEGYVFYSGALFLKSDMTFRVDGIIIGSINPKDYPNVITRWEGWRKLPQTAKDWENSFDDPYRTYMRENRYQRASLINAGVYNEDMAGEISPCNVRNITICGNGQINANGFSLAYNEGPNWKRHKENDFYRAFPPVKNPNFRGRTLAFNNAESVYIKDIELSYSPSWTVHFIFCNNVTFDNVSVISQGMGDEGDGSDLHNCVHIYNGDGIDPECSTYVNIFNSYFRTGDDTVTLKAGRNREGNELNKPNAYIRVTDCLCSWSLGGFGIGSEDASGAHDILYQNLRVENAEIFGYWFKTNPARGSLTENVQLRDCHAEGVRAILVFSHEYSRSGYNNPAKNFPIQRYFKVDNLSGAGNEHSIRLNGFGDKSITDMEFKNINCKGDIDITKCKKDEMKGLF